MVRPTIVAAYIIDPTVRQILLLKRADHVHFPAIWQMVTGKVETEETVSQALKREVWEETGLQVQLAYSVNITQYYESRRDEVGFIANFLIFSSVAQPIAIRPKEHSEYRWATFLEADELLAFSTQKETLRHIREYFLDREPKGEEQFLF